MADTPIVPNFVYCVPDTFNVFLADDIKLDFPPDRLHLGFCYQLAKMPVIASSLKGAVAEFFADQYTMLGIQEYPEQNWQLPHYKGALSQLCDSGYHDAPPSTGEV